MAIDLQKLTLRRLLDTQSNELYSKVLNQYFTGINSVLFDKIKSFYKANTRLPSADEILAIRKDAGLQEYIENQICSDENTNDEVQTEFLVAQLQDYYIRDETIAFMDKFLDDLDNLEKVEIVDKFQNHLLELNQAIPHDDELYDIAELDFFPSADDFKIHPYAGDFRVCFLLHGFPNHSRASCIPDWTDPVVDRFHPSVSDNSRLFPNA